jgi:hypothetical protein
VDVLEATEALVVVLRTGGRLTDRDEPLAELALNLARRLMAAESKEAPSLARELRATLEALPPLEAPDADGDADWTAPGVGAPADRDTSKRGSRVVRA